MMSARPARTQSATLLTLAALTIASLTAGCGGGHEVQPAEHGTPVPVTAASSAIRDRSDTFEAAGVIRGRTSATLASRVMANVREVLVEPGARVRTGQVLVRLDDRDVSAAAREARARSQAAERAIESARGEQDAADAALALARATHGRISALAGRKSATPQELDQAVAALHAAEARVARSRAAMSEAQANLEGVRAGSDAAVVMMSYATIVAPFDGMVTEKLIDPGNLVAPGTPLLRMEDTGTFKLDVRIDESRGARVAPNVPIPVVIDGHNGRITLSGRVTEVARAVDADTRTLLVTIGLPASTGDLTPGMFGRASFPGATRRLLTVPDEAVVRKGQLTNVFVIDGDRARLRFVSVGRSADGATEILAGLSEGESVVIAPPPNVRDGTLVTIRKASSSLASGVTS
jgi:RND family efflux transporter MFP subunit